MSYKATRRPSQILPCSKDCPTGTESSGKHRCCMAQTGPLRSAVEWQGDIHLLSRLRIGRSEARRPCITVGIGLIHSEHSNFPPRTRIQASFCCLAQRVTQSAYVSSAEKKRAAKQRADLHKAALFGVLKRCIRYTGHSWGG
jgi:hypothetical protein